MEQITYYYDLVSQPSRTLFIFFSVNKIPFIRKELQVGLGEHRTEEYGKVNPMKLIPAITCGNFNLSESIAIVRYLCRERYDIADHWYPKDSKARARVDEYLEFQHLGLRAPCALYFRAKWLDPVLKGKTHHPDYVALLKSNMIRACNQFEKIWLGNKPFICGDYITVADIFAATELEQPRVPGFDPREGRPALAAWMERVRRETNPHYDIAHAPLYKLIEGNAESHPAFKAKN